MSLAFRTAALAAVVAVLCASSASAVTIFGDDFNRANNSTVGGNWQELNSSNDDVAISDNQLRLRDNNILSEPDAAAAAGIFSTLGKTNITVSFNWRQLGDDNSSADKLFFSYKVISSLTTAEMQNEGSWTTVPAAGFSTTDQNWRLATINLGPGVDNLVNFAIMLWTDTGLADLNARGFLVDNFTLAGDPVATPIPGAAVLFMSGLLGMGVLAQRRRKKQSVEIQAA